MEDPMSQTSYRSISSLCLGLETEEPEKFGLVQVQDFFGLFFAHSNLPLGTLYRNLTTLSAFNIFVAWIKIFKYLSFNKTMIQLSGTLSAVRTFSKCNIYQCIYHIFLFFLVYFIRTNCEFRRQLTFNISTEFLT